MLTKSIISILANFVRDQVSGSKAMPAPTTLGGWTVYRKMTGETVSPQVESEQDWKCSVPGLGAQQSAPAGFVAASGWKVVVALVQAEGGQRKAA
jgi:hypothetical protein